MELSVLEDLSMWYVKEEKNGNWFGWHQAWTIRLVQLRHAARKEGREV